MTKESISRSIDSALRKISEIDRQQGIKTLFNQNRNRAKQFSYQIDDLYLDFSKTHLTSELVDIYCDYAREIALEDKKHGLFTGEHINVTEDRAVLHTLLRDSDNQGIQDTQQDYLQQAKIAKQQFTEQYDLLNSKLAARSEKIKDIIHVGIGGSSLGSQLAFEALSQTVEDIRIHFVANIDAHQLVSVLAQCDVKTTLVIGVSKTFTTAETLQNLDSIAAWFRDNGVENVEQDFIAVTASQDNALAYGINDSNVVAFPTWVGGRYSVWSSVSLSVALALGMEKFNAFLAGAASMDKYFYQTDLSKNACFLAAAVDHYYVNYFSAGSRAIFAYDYRLRSLVNYLQQLETESNGKDRQLDGSSTDQQTSPVIWGGVGTDVQHSVFQLLHQGTHFIPSEFILVKSPDHVFVEHHNELLANGIAQTAALLVGQDKNDVEAQFKGDSSATELIKKSKLFSGDRPSITFLLSQLNPYNLGALLAFYEHRTFCSGVLVNINSYDQMGVELGKKLAKTIRPLIDNKNQSGEDIDPSTQALLDRIN